MKNIVMTRSELIWETREQTWNESDYQRVLEWLKRGIEEKKETWMIETYSPIYEILKTMTWDEIVEDFKNYQDGLDSRYVLIHRKAYKYDEQNNYIPDPEHDWEYNQYIADFILEQMREDCYSADVYDSEYADDYNETFDFTETSDEDQTN